MKSFFLLGALMLSLLAPSAWAQGEMKIAYVDVDYVLSKLPDVKQVESQLKALNQQLQQRGQAQVKRYQQMLADYQRDAITMQAASKQEAEAELTRLQREIRGFEREAQGRMQQKTSELMVPLNEKVGKSIRAMAKKQGFTHVLTRQVNGVSLVLYADDEYDATDAVLKEMGVAVSGS